MQLRYDIAASTMHLPGILTVFAACIVGIRAPPGHSLQCATCNSVSDPHSCHHYERCGHGHTCATDVWMVDGHPHYRLACRHEDECHTYHNYGLIGKRSHSYRICTECCHDGSGCNKHQCLKYLHATTEAPMTQPTTHPTTHAHHATTNGHLPLHNVYGHLVCKACNGIDDPHQCHIHRRCHPGQVCGTRVYTDGRTFKYSMGCSSEYECHDNNALFGLFGKRRFISVHLSMACQQCCYNTDRCNKDLCGLYYKYNSHVPEPSTTTIQSTTTRQPTTTAPTTTTSSTTLPTKSTTTAITSTTTTLTLPTTRAGPDPDCRDHEEDGFSCSSFDLFNFCTHRSSFAHALAQLKCRKHCGFCIPAPGYDPNATAPPVSRPASDQCVDYEEDGFSCVDFDILRFCTDPNSIAYVVAHEKCRKHCGFCGDKAPATTTDILIPTQEVTATTSTISPTTTVLPTTEPPCVDEELPGFTCSDYDAVNFCTNTANAAYLIAHQLCRKHCGFCTPSSGGGEMTTQPYVVTAVSAKSTTTTQSAPMQPGGGMLTTQVYVPTTASTVAAAAAAATATTATTTTTSPNQPGGGMLTTQAYVPTTASTAAAAAAAATATTSPKQPVGLAGSTSAPIVVANTTVVQASSTRVGLAGSTAAPIVVANTTVVQASSTRAPGACFDDEKNGFSCSSLDAFNFCTDTSSFAHPLAVERCPKHCGFCS